MKLVVSALVVISLVHGVAQAKKITCLVDFGAISESSEAEVVTSATYWRLIDTLAPEMSPELMAKVVKSGEPFAIPKEDSTLALLKHMKQLREMVAAKGWETPEVKGRLLAELGLRAGLIREAERNRNVAIANEWGDYDLPGPVRDAPRGAGNLFVAITKSEPHRLIVHDRATRTTREYPLPDDIWNPPALSADGQTLFLPALKNVLGVPIVNGVPNLTAAVTLKNPLKGGALTDLKPHPNGRYLYASNGDKKIVRFDLKTNKGVSVNVEDFYDGIFVRDWGIIPGTNHLWSIEQGKHGRLLHRFKVNEKGKAELIRASITLEEPIAGLAFSADGKSAIGYTSEWAGHAAQLDLTRRKETSLIPEADRQKYGSVNSAVAHPIKPQVAMLVSKAGDRNGYRIDFVDVTSTTIVRSVPLNRWVQSIAYTPDGEGLIITDTEQTRVHNVRRMMEEP